MNKNSRKILTGHPQVGYGDYFHPKTEKKRRKVMPWEFYLIVLLFWWDSGRNLTEWYVHDNRMVVKGYHEKRDAHNQLTLEFGERRLNVVFATFVHQRKGYFTHLYQILKWIRRRYFLHPIEIDWCITPASQNWCIKNGLVPNPEKISGYIEKE